MIQTYSERLTLAMQRRGVNVTALAKALGLTYQGVKRVVDGHSKAFTAANNEEAAKYLGVSPGWLATGKGDMESGAINANDVWPFTRMSQTQYLSLSNRDRKLLEDIALAMIAESDISSPQPDIQGAMEKVANLAKGDKDEELRGMQASGGGKH
ncbi:hypothetical protein [Achromobacter xylosoxidans]|uniref:hypothetical protein n=1 Tax=Alcaligenes xylosoxydans xylosoxydans TaxID=85698 RepID=UPI0010413157|nr:hypothetical protein [Achromobacter xylosoxidans]